MEKFKSAKILLSSTKDHTYSSVDLGINIWEEMLQSFEKLLDKPTFALVKSLKPTKTSEPIPPNTILLECPTEQVKEWIEKNLGQVIKLEASKKGIFIKLINAPKTSVPSGISKTSVPNGISKDSVPNGMSRIFADQKYVLSYTDTNLSAKYNFDNFIVGKQNEVAYKAALDVAINENSIYNPLFIYGRVGSGKTHLLQAVGNKAYALNKNVLYTSMNDFTEEMVYYLKSGNIMAFREKYKNIDILLIDDIQFLSGKERTQIELFNIFNHLFQHNKHILFASDKHPRDIKDISERLVSRFEGGLLVETNIDDHIKLSIIKQKIQIYGLNVDDRLISYIKDNTTNNAREIEGLVIQIKAKGLSILEAIDNHQNIDNLTSKDSTSTNIDTIKKIVASYFNISIDILAKSFKNKKYATAKHIAIFLSRELTNLSLSEIASHFNIKSHSSVAHSIKKIEKALKEDKTIQYSVFSIKEIIKRQK